MKCFETVFPGQPEPDILRATPDTLERWDSTSHLLLLRVVEEEFQLTIPETTGEELLSFSDFEDFVRSRLTA